MKTLLFILVFLLCGNGYAQTTPSSKVFKPIELYQSDNLIIIQVSENAFVHTSYLQTNDFGNVPCNGMIVRNSNEAIVFDTPTNDTSANELIKFIKEKLHCKVNAIVPTHFHSDCLGGLAAFHIQNIPSFAMVKYFGQGHTLDNVVGYFPSENILFGGCLIKEIEATKGYLGDANVGDWSNTVLKIKKQYPNLKIVIPGHGAIGGSELLDYTIQLFQF